MVNITENTNYIIYAHSYNVIMESLKVYIYIYSIVFQNYKYNSFINK